MLTRILVATDFSAPSDLALEYARGLAGTFGATIHLLHVLPNLFMRAVVGDPRNLEAAALQQLEDRLTRPDLERLQSVAAVERSDEPADVIASYARTHDVHLIVMGTHGRSGLAHVLLGSVAEKVVRTSPCPVLTVHGTTLPADVQITRVLVPTDFSPPSDAALDYARLIAGRFGASLHLLHVLEDRTVDATAASEFFVAEPPDTRTARVRDAQERMDSRIRAGDRERLRASSEVVFGPAAQTIIDYAGTNEADLIVMGTHGRAGIAHFFVGSVAEQVVRGAACAVGTVRDPRVHEVVPNPLQAPSAATS